MSSSLALTRRCLLVTLLCATTGYSWAGSVTHNQGEPPLGPSYYVMAVYGQLSIADLCEVPKPERLSMEAALDLRRQALRILKFSPEDTAYVESRARTNAALLRNRWEAEGRNFLAQRCVGVKASWSALSSQHLLEAQAAIKALSSN